MIWNLLCCKSFYGHIWTLGLFLFWPTSYLRFDFLEIISMHHVMLNQYIQFEGSERFGFCLTYVVRLFYCHSLFVFVPSALYEKTAWSFEETFESNSNANNFSWQIEFALSKHFDSVCSVLVFLSSNKQTFLIDEIYTPTKLYRQEEWYCILFYFFDTFSICSLLT